MSQRLNSWNVLRRARSWPSCVGSSASVGTTGHKWMRRFREQGYAGLDEQSRRPKTAPLATAEELVLAVLEMRQTHPSWGPKKLEANASRHQPGCAGTTRSDATAPATDLDKWRQEFNHVRPHQALGGKTPIEVYSSTNKASQPQSATCYPEASSLVRVFRNGGFRYGGQPYYLSRSLRGQTIALEPLTPGRMRAWFHDIDLRILEVEPLVDDSVYTHLSTSTNTEAA